ncbi:hypothetical protein GCM10022409_03390 [Hymenobacter glaciei]|uniref:Uncharacterized protein n=1 Tax=Hymenobacter glaciei TaxID=877209 RepID=A0ABP7T959_9BACT
MPAPSPKLNAFTDPEAAADGFNNDLEVGAELAQDVRRPSLTAAVASTATKLLPLVALLDSIQPSVSKESVFRIRRRKIKQHFTEVYAELHAERPRREALTHAFQALAELVLEETRDISKDELKQAAKEVVLATLQNAPALINIAHQARLLA